MLTHRDGSPSRPRNPTTWDPRPLCFPPSVHRPIDKDPGGEPGASPSEGCRRGANRCRGARPRSVRGRARGSGTAVPMQDPELWFAETPADLELAKTHCLDCPVRRACLLRCARAARAVGRVGWRDLRARCGHPAQAAARPSAQGGCCMTRRRGCRHHRRPRRLGADSPAHALASRRPPARSHCQEYCDVAAQRRARARTNEGLRSGGRAGPPRCPGTRCPQVAAPGRARRRARPPRRRPGPLSEGTRPPIGPGAAPGPAADPESPAPRYRGGRLRRQHQRLGRQSSLGGGPAARPPIRSSAGPPPDH